MANINYTNLGNSIAVSGAVAVVKTNIKSGETYDVAVPTANGVITGAKLVVKTKSSTNTSIELKYGTDTLIPAHAITTSGEVVEGDITAVKDKTTDGDKVLSIVVSGADSNDAEFAVTLEYNEPFVRSNQFLAIKK